SRARDLDPPRPPPSSSFAPPASLRQPLVGDGWKVQTRHDDLRARPVVERLGHRRERARDVCMEGHLRGRGPDHPRVSLAQLAESRPPDVVPGRGPAPLPEIEVLAHPRAGPGGECAEGTAIQIDRVAEDRELVPNLPPGRRRNRCGGHSPGNIPQPPELSYGYGCFVALARGPPRRPRARQSAARARPSPYRLGIPPASVV